MGRAATQGKSLDIGQTPMIISPPYDIAIPANVQVDSAPLNIELFHRYAQSHPPLIPVPSRQRHTLQE